MEKSILKGFGLSHRLSGFTALHCSLSLYLTVNYFSDILTSTIDCFVHILFICLILFLMHQEGKKEWIQGTWLKGFYMKDWPKGFIYEIIYILGNDDIMTLLSIRKFNH